MLNLGSNSLGAEAIAKLVLADLPKLVHLALMQNQLDAAAMAQLCKGSWPELRSLDLQCNLLDSAAMISLARGNWPHLSALKLHHNKIMSCGLRLLTAGQWPLFALMMDASVVSTVTSELLDLAPRSCWIHRDAEPGGLLVLIPRNTCQDLQLWPLLVCLLIAKPVTALVTPYI